jgi:hypothetical protein
MVRSDGKNVFPGNRFCFWEWSAPILQTPAEVIQKALELRLEGRTVKDITAVGIGYNWTSYEFGSACYMTATPTWPAAARGSDDPAAAVPADAVFRCLAQIDEPLVISFEDGDSLGISFEDASCVRLELNTLPRLIGSGINGKNFHANRLFYEAIGKKIAAVEVAASTEYPDFWGSHGVELEEQPCYISKVDLVLDDRKRLSFSPFFDYGWVELVDGSGQWIGVPAEKLTWILEGYYPS